MTEKFFEREFGARRLAQVETGVVIEYCDRAPESFFEEEDASDFLFGSMEPDSRAELPGEHALYGAAEQLYRLDLIREIPDSPDFLPPVCGTSVRDIEHLLGMQDSSFEALHGASLPDITEALAQDYRVLCPVRMSHPAQDAAARSLCEAGCLAEVRGIDLRSPDSAKVCLEALNGHHASWQCSLEEFMKAWQPHGSCYVIYQESGHEY